MTRPAARWSPLDPALRDRLLTPVDPAAGPVDCVVDTDATNEVDDEWAVAWALCRPDRLRVRALHACPYEHGPRLLSDPGFLTPPDAARLRALLEPWGGPSAVPVVPPAEGVARAAARLRELAGVAGVDVPVVVGSDRWLPDASTPVRSEAAEHLVELAHEDRDGPLHVLGLGAATTLASALLLDPSVRERVVVAWTSAFPTSWPRPNASFNLAQDVPAGRVLLESGVPLVYLPGYQVGEELRLTLAESAAHVAPTGPLGAWLDRLWREHPVYGDATPGASKVLWDLVCVAWLVNPSWLWTELGDAPTLDEDLRWVPGAGHRCREALDVDRDGVVTDLVRALAAHGARGGPGGRPGPGA